MESYDTELAAKALLYDVLKTPKEQGLLDGHVIHIKDLKSQDPKRPKIVVDLFLETDIEKSKQDVLDIQIEYHDKDYPTTFLISLLGSS